MSWVIVRIPANGPVTLQRTESGDREDVLEKTNHIDRKAQIVREIETLHNQNGTHWRGRRESSFSVKRAASVCKVNVNYLFAKYAWFVFRAVIL